MSRSAPSSGKEVTLHAAAASLPALTLATEGEDISSWRQGPQAPRVVEIAIDANGGAGTLADGYLCGYHTGKTMWRKLAKIQNGETITLTATCGWADTFVDVAGYDRLALEGTVGGGNAVDVYARPVEVL